MPQRSVAHPMVTRAARVVPASINETEHTAEVVFTTGAQVRRMDWWRELTGGDGEYIEELEVSEQAIDMARLNSGAPFLDSHMQWETRHIAGAVERGWVVDENGQPEGRALIRFDVESDLGKELWRKVQQRFLNFVSVGYLVERYQEFMRDGMRVLRAVRWTPVEISAVAVPADAGAGFRSGNHTTRCVIEPQPSNKGTRSMSKRQQEEEERKRKGRADSADDDETREDDESEEEREEDEKEERGKRSASLSAKRAAEAATRRVTEIMDLCALAGRSLIDAQKYIASDQSVEDIRSELVSSKAAAGETELRNQHPGGAATSGDYKPGALRERMAQQLQRRGIKPADAIQGV